MSSDDRQRLNVLLSGLRVFADAQPALKAVVINRMLDLISELLQSLIDRIEKLERKADHEQHR